jgi:hypothetical protein
VSSRRAGAAALLALVAAGAPGCQVAYIPGEERAKVDTEDPAALRRAVLVLPSECTARQARAIVRNRSDKTVDVTVEVAWSTRQGGSVVADTKLTVGPDAQKTVTVPAPRGATADIGCQASKTEVTARP